jgi:hypothetical protein
MLSKQRRNGGTVAHSPEVTRVCNALKGCDNSVIFGKKLPAGQRAVARVGF